MDTSFTWKNICMCLSVCLSVYICTKASIMVNSETLETFPLKSGTDFRGPQSTLLFNHILAVPASTIRQEKEIRNTKIGKEEVKLSLLTGIVCTTWKPKRVNPKTLQIMKELLPKIKIICRNQWLSYKQTYRRYNGGKDLSYNSNKKDKIHESCMKKTLKHCSRPQKT